MKETSFIAQNEEKWRELEKILASGKGNENPEKLNELFVQLTDDLSYARTYYGNRSISVYLNNLAQMIFFRIFKSRKTNLGRIRYFWTDDLPLVIYQSRRVFLFAFLIFSLAVLIGAFSTAMDPEFPRVILGDAYVDMTLQNIESGDPMAVYKKRGALGMSLGITANNLLVAFRVFAMGVFLSIGTVGILLFNGIMLGSFQYFFYDQGLLQESFLTIWMHGTLEISAIIIAGAAGMMLGSGLIFPGTLPRLQAFSLSARKGFKIMLGTVPLFLIAGVIEGFFTRYTEAPDILRLFFILLCLGFVLFYYIWYPRKINRQHEKAQRRPLPPAREYEFSKAQIYTNGELFAFTYLFFRHGAKYFLSIAILITVGCIMVPLLFSGLNQADLLPGFQVYLANLSGILNFFVEQGSWLAFMCKSVALSLLFLLSSITLIRIIDPDFRLSITAGLGKGLFIWLITGGLLYILQLVPEWTYLFIIPAGIPVIWIALFHFLYQRHSSIQAFSSGLGLSGLQFWGVVGLVFLILCMFFLIFQLADSSFLWFYVSLVGWNLVLPEDVAIQVMEYLRVFIAYFFFFSLVTTVSIAVGLKYFSLREINNADGLQHLIDHFGEQRKIQGLLRENR